MRKLFLSLLLGVGFAFNAGAQNANAGPTIVIVVRHAEKAASPANDPPLTEAGAARAKALAAALADAKVDAVISTPTTRTRETARPTAEARGLTVETVAAGPAAMADAARKHAGQTVLLVGHSNTVAAIIAALGGPKMADLCDTQFSMLYTVVLDGKSVRMVKSSYGTVTPDTPEACPAMGR